LEELEKRLEDETKELTEQLNVHKRNADNFEELYDQET